MLFLQAVRGCRLKVSLSRSKWRVHRKGDRPFLIEAKDTPRVWLRLRSRVLRRDRHRCRGCDKKSEGTSLTIHKITTGPPNLNETLTLCISCRTLAKKLGLEGIDIPDFLRQLWCHLHPRAEPTNSELPNKSIGSTGR